MKQIKKAKDIHQIRKAKEQFSNTEEDIHQFLASTDGQIFKTYFVFSEFDSPDMLGSGLRRMNLYFLSRLSEARQLADAPFVITSGYRTPQYNEKLESKGYKVSRNSAHLRGVAADISTPTPRMRHKIVSSLLEVGFNRLGIGPNFVHVDMDLTKTPNLIWTY